MAKGQFTPLIAIRELLIEWVEKHQDFTNLQWTKTNSPEYKIRINLEDDVETSHYFLIVASITESNIISRAENSRYVITYLHHQLRDDLFRINEAEKIQSFLVNYPSYNILGDEKEQISQIIANVNNYVNNYAAGNLMTYYPQFDKPQDFVDDIEAHIPRLSGFYVEKAWMYLKWMTRPQDLGVFRTYHPRDLMLPLTSYIREVVYRFGLCPDHEDWPPDRITLEKTRQKCTDFTLELFPEDPTKVDYPFYLLGRWLKGRPYRTKILYDSLVFFKEISRPDYYKTFKIDISRDTRLFIESMTKQVLEDHGIGYERYSFNLPYDCMAPQYTPDFILPETYKKGRKVLLEPHGVHWSSGEPSGRSRFEIEFIDKLWNFKNEYDKEYYIILFVPERHTGYVDLRYSDIFDEIWSFSDIPRIIKSLKRN